ncbi:hypothetical protein [Mycobacteroides abscessus]|uniref:hypothetical protein n=1 Tax=Mycobacteroides abscessus TaxID=36809 RepID=UPI00078E84A9|nr:hypothetical protein [Mycobacteroides abscessus]AMU74391.1 hypothetical protein A3O06_06750 [Mycobacteroides abscessus]ANO23327.1 hypothetical protein BAB79_06745 [Mycobacteroides abscessus]
MDAEHEEVERLRDWIERLEAFTAALDDIEGEDATDFANNVLEALNDAVVPNLVPAKSPSMLLALEAVVAVTQAAIVVIMDWADTPDVRDRYTRETAQPLFKTALDGVLSRCRSWLSDGLPPADEVQQRIAAGAKEMQEAQETLGRRNAELEAQDAEAEADPYGAILIHLDLNRSDAPLFEKVCSLTEDEDKRYSDAYERLRRMIDSELLRHISDENDRFCDQLMAVLIDLRDNRIGLFDEDAWDEHRRKIRSALISFTAALYSHREQTVRAAKKDFGRDSEQVQAVEKLFSDLRKSSFDYGWLEELRGALQHGDINAFGWGFGASMHDEPTANVYMKRQFMLDFTAQSAQKKWLKRTELADRGSDPSVLDMIKAIQPQMGPLQEKLDRILYPNAGEDAATVREFLARYPDGVQGYRALQTGPGFTRRTMFPKLSLLAPRVLAFADSFQGWED